MGRDLPADPHQPQRPPTRQTPTRIEYLDSRTDGDCREFRLSVHAPEGPLEVRFRISTAAFAANHVLLQDGPDFCYQLLLRRLAQGETPSQEVMVADSELAAYRQAHTPAPRRTTPPTAKPARVRRTPVVETRARLPVAAPSPPMVAEPSFEEGQRVSHPVFGAGVTLGSSGGRTSVQFDEHGTKTFVTSMVVLETLSAPHTWEAGPRGKNRPRQ